MNFTNLLSLGVPQSSIDLALQLTNQDQKKAYDLIMASCGHLYTPSIQQQQQQQEMQYQQQQQLQQQEMQYQPQYQQQQLQQVFQPVQQLKVKTASDFYGKPCKGFIRKLHNKNAFGFIKGENFNADLIFSFAEIVDFTIPELQVGLEVWFIPIHECKQNKLMFYAKSVSSKMGTTRVHYNTQNPGKKIEKIPNTQTYMQYPYNAYMPAMPAMPDVATYLLQPPQNEPVLQPAIPPVLPPVLPPAIPPVLPPILQPAIPPVLPHVLPPTIPLTTETKVEAKVEQKESINKRNSKSSHNAHKKKVILQEEQEEPVKNVFILYYGKIQRYHPITRSFTILRWTTEDEWESKEMYMCSEKELRETLPFDSLKEGMKVEFRCHAITKEIYDIYQTNVISLDQAKQLVIDREFFCIGSIYQKQESRIVEFKNFSNNQLPSEEMLKMVEKNVIGFLNSRKGGSLFFGINDHGEIVGTVLNFKNPREHADRLNTQLSNCLKNCNPAVDPFLYEVKCHKLFQRKFEGYKECHDKWIIEIVVFPHNHHTLWETSGNYDGIKTAYIRMEASTERMSAAMIRNRILMDQQQWRVKDEYEIKEEEEEEEEGLDEIEELVMEVQNKLGITNKKKIVNAIVKLKCKGSKITLESIAEEMYC